jgi:hypothetical protein
VRRARRRYQCCGAAVGSVPAGAQQHTRVGGAVAAPQLTPRRNTTRHNRHATPRHTRAQVYPDPVRVVAIGKSVEELLASPDADDNLASSVEFCGGTHLKNTSEVRAAREPPCARVRVRARVWLVQRACTRTGVLAGCCGHLRTGWCVQGPCLVACGGAGVRKGGLCSAADRCGARSHHLHTAALAHRCPAMTRAAADASRAHHCCAASGAVGPLALLGAMLV